MKKLIFLGILILVMTLPVSAAVVAPAVPEEGESVFPEQQENFGESLLSMMKQAISQLSPQFRSGLKLCGQVLAATLALTLFSALQGRSRAVVELAGVLTIAVLLLSNANSMIKSGTETVWSISEYGKLLLPVMTVALAAQGGTTEAASLYGATALFDTVLCSVISSVLTPLIYIYLVLAILNALTGDDLLKKLKDLCKWAMSWFFKVILSVFTGYITISGVVSGTADQTAIKAAKLTISTAVPVVGSILSDASESVLVSAAVVKNAAGIYGLLAILAVTILPFLTIGIHYLLLKVTAALSGAFAPKCMTGLLEDFSSGMGLVLAMVGSVCLIQLISVVCFLKGMT